MSKDKSKKKSKVEKPKSGLALSEDRWLLMKTIPAKCLKEVVDISDVDFVNIVHEKEVKDSVVTENVGGSSVPPAPGLFKTHMIQKLYEYHGRTPKEGDIVCWYNDIGMLSGSAGYLLLRDGYVENQVAIWRS